MFITVLVVALRFVARLVTGSKLGWDDYLILAAIPQIIGLLICEGLCKFFFFFLRRLLGHGGLHRVFAPFSR